MENTNQSNASMLAHVRRVERLVTNVLPPEDERDPIQLDSDAEDDGLLLRVSDTGTDEIVDHEDRTVHTNPPPVTSHRTRLGGGGGTLHYAYCFLCETGSNAKGRAKEAYDSYVEKCNQCQTGSSRSAAAVALSIKAEYDSLVDTKVIPQVDWTYESILEHVDGKHDTSPDRIVRDRYANLACDYVTAVADQLRPGSGTDVFSSDVMNAVRTAAAVMRTLRRSVVDGKESMAKRTKPLTMVPSAGPSGGVDTGNGRR